MEFNRVVLKKFTWGVLLLVVAAALLFIGVTGTPLIHAIPLVMLVTGIWILVSETSYASQAWGIIIAVAGALWLLTTFFPLSLYVVLGIFLTVVGALVIVGSRKL